MSGTSSRGKARRGERGGAMVEFALVGIVFLALLLAAFDFGYVIFARTMMRFATREGVRFAVTGQVLDGMGHDASIRTVVSQNSLGLVKAHETDKIKIQYYVPDASAETALNAQGNMVAISVENFSHWPMAPLLRPTDAIPIEATSVGRVEDFPGTPPTR